MIKLFDSKMYDSDKTSTVSNMNDAEEELFLTIELFNATDI